MEAAASFRDDPAIPMDRIAIRRLRPVEPMVRPLRLRIVVG
jgi:hypothetical protein